MVLDEVVCFHCSISYLFIDMVTWSVFLRSLIWSDIVLYIYVSSIRGTTGVEIVSGLHWYLKYWCGAHVSWDKTGGVQTTSIPKPGSLPLLKDEGVKIKRPVPWNYYQNVVTSSCEYQNQLSIEQDISCFFLYCTIDWEFELIYFISDKCECLKLCYE
jgi:hypothetical protein